MNPRFDYDDIIIVASDAPPNFRPGSKGWVVGIISDRTRFPLNHLPDGVIYTVEFEDGFSCDISEDLLTAF